MTQITEAACWLALLEADDLPRRAAKQAIRKWCLEDARSMREFLHLDAQDLSDHVSLSRPVLQQMLTKRDDVAAWEERLTHLATHDIHLLLRHEAAYPDLLAERLDPAHQPFYLYYQGNLELLAEPGLLTLGANEPSRAGATLAHSLGEKAASLPVHAVGGYDDGIERLVQDAIVSAGGASIIVLPLGIQRFTKALSAMSEPLQDGRLLVISPYTYDAELSELRSDARRTITASLSGVCVVIEPHLAPKEWSGHDALRAGHVPTYVWQHGNDDLVAAWTHAKAETIANLDEALKKVASWIAPAENSDMVDPIPLDEAESHGVEPIRFKDADDAVQRLSQSGQVPERLKRQLEGLDWTDDDL